MSDARLSASFPTHPKTKKLMRRLGAAGPWALVCLFLWARMNRADGDLVGMTDEDIELACDWAGDEGALVAALVSVGFLDGEEGSRKIHDWAEHQPWSAGAEDRKQSSAWAALCKRYGREGAAQRMPEYATRMRPAREPHAASVPTACGTDAPLPLPSPLPSPEAKEESKAKSKDWSPKDPAPTNPAQPTPIESARGSRLAADWAPSEADLAFAATERPDLNAATEAAAFRDFWHAKPGADGRKVDWSATWRNWIRKCHARPGARGSPVAASGVAARFDGKTYKGATDDELEAFFGRA
jgi:hypothetical protein